MSARGQGSVRYLTGGMLPLPSSTVNENGWQHWRTVSRMHYSHSIVPGGLLVTSRTTRLTPGTSLVIRVETVASTS